jgi:hypothetical protein
MFLYTKQIEGREPLPSSFYSIISSVSLTHLDHCRHGHGDYDGPYRYHPNRF